MKKIALLMVGFLLIVSCSTPITSTGSNEANALHGQWSLIDEETGGIVQGLQDKPVTLFFDSSMHNVNGFAGCNQYGGDYKASENNLNFGDLYSTKMACPDLSIEDKFFELLNQVDQFEIKSNKLYLYKGKMLLLQFKK